MIKQRQIVKIKKGNRLLGTVRINWPPASSENRKELLERISDTFECIDPSRGYIIESSYYNVKSSTGRPMKRWD